jgi:hypothetical protein
MTIHNTNYRQNFYCELIINDLKLIPSNIIDCTIREWIFDVLPRLELTLQDDGVLTEIRPLTDESIIKILLGKNPDDDNMMEVEFKYENSTIDIVGDNQYQILTITGSLNVNNGFHPRYNKAFRNKNSLQVLQSISTSMGLNYRQPLNFSTSDVMTWLQINQNNVEMIQEVLNRSYRSNDCIFGYADINKNFNTTTLKTATNSEFVKYAKYDLEKYTNDEFAEDIDNKILWFNSYDLIDFSNYFNKRSGYGTRCDYYDKSQNKSIEITEDYHPFTKDSTRSNIGDIVSRKVFGTQNGTYKDYFRAMIQNEYYKQLFFSKSIILNVNSTIKVDLMDKVNVFLPSKIIDDIDDVYSGNYLVGGIVYDVVKGNILKKSVCVYRTGNNESSLNKGLRNG